MEERLKKHIVGQEGAIAIVAASKIPFVIFNITNWMCIISL